MTRGWRFAAACVLAAVASLALISPAKADTYRDQQWHLPFLKIAEAHKISQGEGITVAVIDSGIEAKHPDLVKNVLTGLDIAPGGSGNGWGDLDGHGTGMAGIIAAHGRGTSDGVLGIAPKAKILPIRIQVVTKAENGKQPDPITGEMLLRAFEEAINRGAKVISVSMAINSGPHAVDIQRLLERSNVVVMAAAGNSSSENLLQSPANFRGVLAVSAVDKDGNPAVSVKDERIALSAPGVDVVTASRIISETGTQYRKSTGTSPATAIAAGAAALVWSKNPQWTNQEVVRQLQGTATDKGNLGRDKEYGFGIVDPLKALTAPLVQEIPSAQPTPAASEPAPEVRDAAAEAPKKANRTVYVVAIIGGLAALVLLVAGLGGYFLLRRRRATPRSGIPQQ